MAKKIQPIERCDCDVIREEIVNKVREKCLKKKLYMI